MSAYEVLVKIDKLEEVIDALRVAENTMSGSIRQRSLILNIKNDYLTDLNRLRNSLKYFTEDVLLKETEEKRSEIFGD